MSHNLTNTEIRQMYDLLYAYEKRLCHIADKKSFSISGLDLFLSNNDIYVDTMSIAHANTGNLHNGHILFRQANASNRDFYLIRHIRNAFAHALVIANKKKGRIKMIAAPKSFKLEMPKQLTKPFFSLLQDSLVNTIQKSK